MGESFIAIGAKNAHTWQRLVGATNVEDEFVLPGEFPYPSYIAEPATGVSCAAAGDDVAQLMAGVSLNVRIRRIRVEQFALITTSISTQLQVFKVTTAGTGGTAITPTKADNGDSASGATAASGVPNATRGTAGAMFLQRTFWPVQTVPVGGTNAPFWEWVEQPGMKPLIIPAGAANGIVIRNPTARAALTVSWEIEFIETAFL
jgi:hypothetical protein